MKLRTVFAGAALLASIVGCSQAEPIAGQDGRAALVDLEAEPEGANCAYGGQAIRTGTDQNGNGELDLDEVAETRYVCNGAAGAPGLDGRDGTDGANGVDGQDGANGADGADGADGRDTVFDVADEPAGSNCPHGGKALRHGIDLDRDGQLDSEEVLGTQYVCNGAPGVGLNSLVLVTPETAGSNCAFGGQAIRTGVDDSGDGVLQPLEVDSTSYVCNGATGLSSMTRQEDELPGANCSHGGRSLMTGLDADSDGYLDGGEVTSTSYVCNGADGAPGHASLILMETESPGSNCAAGGFSVRYGLDLDDDGVLSESEATVRYLCNGEDGADGLQSLVAVIAEDAGENCAAGGQRIDSGLDRNVDGTLDPFEVSATRFVCNGEDGVSPHASLVRVSDEPAGANCLNGGLKLESGIDEDDTGTLEPAEIDSIGFICHGGEVAIRVSNAAWGGVCGRGGIKVETGIDGDGNGLDDLEVERTQYVCNVFFAQIAAGAAHTCALLSNGAVQCWGYNGSGQLGDGSLTNRFVPVVVSGLPSAVSVVAGGSHTCALLADGSARCWGRNTEFQLGDNTGTSRSNPVEVVGLSSTTSLAAGAFHTCALLADGSVRCWGQNAAGQLGDGTTTNRYSPVAVRTLSSVASIAAGSSHTCALLDDRSARCWGANSYGQLGNGSSGAGSTSPVPVSGLSSATNISAGSSHVCAVLADNTAVCWGHNGYGQLGDGSTSTRTVPAPVSGFGAFVSLGLGSWHTCATLVDGTARCWGYNSYGQLGGGSVTNPITGLSAVSGIAAGDSHSCAVASDGSARCWGYNSYGQLGDGSTTTRYAPVAIPLDLSP